jgi:hypothetical protein
MGAGYTCKNAACNQNNKVDSSPFTHAGMAQISTVTTVPEPASVLLMATLAAVTLAGVRRKLSRTAQG